jgi:mannose/fructose/N-acetylgalactosamine-specific phosphotransferase system component IID
MMYLVAIAWIYVVLMMAVAEATSSTGSVLGAIITFLLYGLLPLSIVIYLMRGPQRKAARLVREAQAREADAAAAESKLAPDASSHAATDAVAPVRKEP